MEGNYKESTFECRVNEMLEILNLTKSEYCKRTGIGLSTLSNYIHGNRKPDSNFLIKMTRPFGINPSWLMGFNTPMYISDLNDLVRNKMIEMESTPFVYKSGDEEYVLDIQKLNPDGRQALKSFLEFLLQNRDYRKEDN